MINSFKKNKTGILLILVSSIFVCVGQLFWKLGENDYLYLLIGFGLYGFGALIMLIAYKFGSLSVLQPMLSMNYVFSLILAHFILKETITIKRIIGILIIMIGVVLIGGGDE